MTWTDVLGKIFWGNSVSRWLWAMGIFLAVLVAVWILKRFVLKRLRAWAESTETKLDNLVVAILGRTRSLLALLVALWAGSRVLLLPDRLHSLIESAAIVAVLLQIGIWASTALEEWLEVVSKRKAEAGEVLTWLGGLEWIGKVAIWTVLLLIGLENLGVDVTGLVTGLGIGGIAVALAAQNILGDLFSAFSIYIDRPFVIGDYLVVGGFNGTVEKIGMKTTRIRALSGEQLIFGNSDLVSSRIQNYGRLIERRAVFGVGVTYDTPQEKLERIPDMIREIIESQENVRFDRSHFKAFGDSSLQVETVYWVLQPPYQAFMDVQQAINLEIKRRFDAESIDFAFPTQTIHLETGKTADG